MNTAKAYTKHLIASATIMFCMFTTFSMKVEVMLIFDFCEKLESLWFCQCRDRRCLFTVNSRSEMQVDNVEH